MCLVLNIFWFKLWYFFIVKCFFELLVLEINCFFNSLILFFFFLNMVKLKVEFCLNGVKDFFVKYEIYIKEILYRI